MKNHLFHFPLLGFDAFNNNSTAFGEQVDMIKDTASLFYQVELRIAIYASVIAVILVGLSFVIQGTAAERAKNKAWIIRLAGIILFIFGLGALLIQIISKATVSFSY